MSELDRIFQFESVPEDAPPFFRSNDEIADLFFKDAEKTRHRNMTVWNGAKGGSVLVQRILAGTDDDGDGKLDVNEIEEQYLLRIFVSRDQSKLEKAYHQYLPDKRELVLFIEDNSTDTFSGTYINLSEREYEGFSVLAHLPPAFEKWLDEEFETFLSGTSDLGFDIDITRLELKSVIESKRYKFSNIQSIEILMRAFQIGFGAASSGFYWVGKEIFRLTNDIRAEVQVPESGWNPGFVDPKGNRPEGPFQPYLLHGIHNVMSLSKNSSDVVQNALIAGLYALKGDLLQRLVKVRRFASHYQLPGHQFFAKHAELLIHTMTFEIASSISRHFQSFEKAGSELIYAINAYYSGLWNSLVDSVLGIVDLFGCLFYALGLYYQGLVEMANLRQYWEQVSELIDEFITALINLSAKDVIVTTIDSLVSIWQQVDLSSFMSQTGFSLSQVSYFIGGVAGIVIEIAIDIASGGTKAIQTAITKFGDIVKFFKTLLDDVISTVGKLAEDVFAFAVELMKYVTEQLRKGGKGVEEMIQSLAEIMKGGFKSLDDFMRQIDQEISDWAARIASDIDYTVEEIKEGWQLLKTYVGDDEIRDIGSLLTCKL